MSSLLENYKKVNDLDYESDLNVIQQLYKNNESYQKKYSFEEFVTYATENSVNKLDGSLSEYTATPKYTQQKFGDLLKQSMILKADSTIALNNRVKDLTKEEVAELMPLKNTRKTIGGIIDKVATGTIGLAGDALFPVNPYEQVSGNKFRLKTKEDILAEEEQRKTKTQEAVSSVLRPVMTLGTDDIYEGAEIQRPEGMVGRLGVDFGAFLLAMKNPKQVASFLKKDKPTIVLKKPVGRPSKVSIQAANVKALRDKKIAALKGLGKAEYASQVVFADDPEMQFVAGLLKDKLGTIADDNLLGDVLEYLDTDETSTAGQRRLSLLFDGAAFLGLLKSAVVGGKVLKKGTGKTYETVLNEIKKDPKKVQALKTYLRDPIQKVVPSFKSDIVDDVFVKTAESGMLKSPLNFLRQVRRKFGTSRGYYSEEMFNIFKSAGYDKIAWSKQGENLFNELQYQIKQISQTGKFTKDEVEILLGKYLAGDVKALNGTSKEFKKVARQTRNKIDELSASLLETKVIPEELKRVIRLNMGSYLRQSYELFENPNFKPSEEVILKAKDYIAGLLREAPTQTEMFETVGKLTPSQIEVKASNIVDDILSKGVRNKGIDTDIVKHFNDVFGVQKANIKFATRENIAKPLQDLMGRRGLKDTSKSVFNTIETLGHYITEVKMYDDMFKRGEGKWFFKNGINTLDNNPQRVAGTISGEGFGALDNMSTTPQIAKLFDKMNKVQNSNWYARAGQLFLGAKGWGQASATVYSLTTHARNTIGGGLIMASNGLNPFDAETRKAFKTLQNELFAPTGRSKKELEKVYVKYQKLGLVNQSVQVGEFKRNINSAAFLDDYIKQQDENFAKLAYGSTSNLIKNVTNKVSKVYVAEDDLWRIAAFEKELAVLKKANNLSTAPKTAAQLEQEAATIIRNTMPTYDLVPAGFQELRAMPFGNFYSFFAERWRNSYHSLTQGLKEVKSGNAELVERGYQRLASQVAIGYAGAEGVNQFSKYAFGVSDEEEQAIKDLALPFWSKNSTIGYQRDKDGNIQWVDLSFTDPQAPIIDVFKNGLDEFLNPDTPNSTINDKLANAIIQSGITLAKPFMTEALFTERLLEAYTGRDNQTGRYIEGYNPTNSSIDNAMAITWHVGGVLVPRFVRQGFSYTLGEKAEKLKEGDLNYNNELLSKVTGQRFYTVNSKTVKDNLYFKAREFNKIQEQVSSGFKINKGDTTKDIINKYVRQNENYYNYQVDFNKALKAANTLNLDSLEMSNTIKRTLTNFNSIEKQSFLLGDDTFKPLRLNNFNFNIVFKMDDKPNISYLDFVELYSNTYQKLSNLPLIEKNKYSKQEQEALEMVNPPIRLNKIKGGLISGPEVSDTKENPADRVDPFTGAPYSDQMARLGLAEGGIPLFEDRINNPSNYSYIKQGKELLTHRMAQSDNIAYPMIQLQSDGTLKDYGDDFEGARKAAIKNKNFKTFKTEDEAIAYAEGGYKTKEFNEYYNNERVRLGLNKGGIINRLRDYLDMTDVDARRIEQEAAEMVNQLVDEGLISEDQRQKLGPESKGGIRYLQDGKTPATNDIIHQIYASRVGDSGFIKRGLQKTALFAREKIQAFEKPEDSALDELNNQIGFAIYEEAQGDPDKINELIRQKAIEKYKVD